MPFSLLIDAWIPVRHASGRAQIICPANITDTFKTDPIVALDWPRPDFRLASLEFLIGLLATACPPEDDDGSGEAGDWLEAWATPPSPETLAARFAPFARAFVLDGDGPRFMQDFEDFGGETNRLETLLIEAPGAQTLKKNTDHFNKRDTVTTLGRAAAAMALYTLQSFAPAGGAGNRVGLRGGGPLTTLAMPPMPDGKRLTLWHLLWANVLNGVPAKPADLPKIFPWLAPTRTSEKGGRTTSPADVHPLQAYWGMARRIRLDFAENIDATPCDLGGDSDAVVVRGWRQRPYGANYANWQHPLSPYYRQNAADPELLPVHGQPGGVGYRHWVGLLIDDAAALRFPAQVIANFRRARLPQVATDTAALQWRMLAAGFDMDNMKARGFVESEMPIIEPKDRAYSQVFAENLRLFIASAADVASLLGRAVRRALFSDGTKVPLDAGLIATLRERFGEATELMFLRLVQECAAGEDPMALRRRWLAQMTTAARTLFVEAAPIDARGADHRPDRIAAAARGLDFALRGFGKDGDALFRQLGLPSPEKAKKPPSKSGKATA